MFPALLLPQRLVLTLLVLLPLVINGCHQSYVTPGGPVQLDSFTAPDEDIRERLLRQPAAPFPARIAIVRVQGPDYRSYTNDSYGTGNFSVVTTRDVETDEDFERLTRLPMVAGLAPINRLLLPRKLMSEYDLRRAAATVKADLLLIYTFDTQFRLDEKDVGPLRLVSLGMLPTKEAVITTTASAVFCDVRSGFVYGLAEATAKDKGIASEWTTNDAVDRCRRRAEEKAFKALVEEVEKTWKGVVEEHVKQRGMM